MEISLTRDVQMLSTGVLGAFAVFHLILYLQHRAAKANLIFSLGLVFAAAATFLDYQVEWAGDLSELLLRLQRVASLGWGLLLYQLVLTLFDRQADRERILVLSVAAVLVIPLYLRPVALLPLGYVGTGLIAVVVVRHTLAAIRERRPNAGIVAVGVAFVFLSTAYDLVLDAFFPRLDLAIRNGYPFGIMGFVFAMSWGLGRDTAMIQQRLAEEEQARRSSDEELRRRQADMADARRLQQSFLPNCPVESPYLDVCFEQRMALEVGGDYYDYHQLDGALLLAVGDATGHGTRGGLMVAAVKTLFQTADVTAPPDEIIRQASRVIRQMQLQSMFMGLTVARIEPDSIQISSAGMPPALVLRSRTGAVEQVIQKTMPLGAFDDFPYETTTLSAGPGDTLLLMSDGLVECFDADRNQLGVEPIESVLRRGDFDGATDLLRAILAVADEWRGDAPVQDDTTLAVVQIRAS